MPIMIFSPVSNFGDQSLDCLSTNKRGKKWKRIRLTGFNDIEHKHLLL